MSSQLLGLILRVPGFLIAMSVHEYAHARTAFKLGDDTAERMGRMTLEPWAHIDPVGAIMLLLFRFGWARPVPVDPYRLRNPRRDMAKVALAGPVANLIIAFVVQIATMLLATRIRFRGTAWAYLPVVLQEAVFINAGLGVFNLIPVPPLDGSRILEVFLPHRAMDFWDAVERYGFVILVILLLTGIIPAVIGPIIDAYLAVVQNIGLRLSLMLFRVR